MGMEWDGGNQWVLMGLDGGVWGWQGVAIPPPGLLDSSPPQGEEYGGPVEQQDQQAGEYGGADSEYGGLGHGLGSNTPDSFKTPFLPPGTVREEKPKLSLTDKMKKPSKVIMLKVSLTNIMFVPVLRPHHH